MGVYVTETGFQARRQPEIKADLQNAYKQIYGVDVQLAEESVNGQTIGVLSEIFADLWNGLGIVYHAFDPSATVGVTQDLLYSINGLTRKPPVKSSADLLITGTPTTSVLAGFQASTESGLSFATTEDAEIGGGGTVTVSSECTIDGTYEAPAGTIVNIDTVIPGVESVTNPADAIPGKFEESDALYRLRRQFSTGGAGQNLLESAYARLANLAGVANVRIYQNRTNAVDPLTGAPAHSWTPVLIGGDNNEIAEIIWLNTSAGVATWGNVNVPILDSQGYEQNIEFERAVDLPIYVEVQTSVDLLEFPADGDEQIKQNIIDYAAGTLLFETAGFTGFGIGENVLRTRLYTPVNRVQGHNVLTIRLSDVSPPVYVETDIIVDWNRISSWDIDNISVLHV